MIDKTSKVYSTYLFVSNLLLRNHSLQYISLINSIGYDIPDDIDVIREFMLVKVFSFLIFALCEIIFWIIRWIIIHP